MDKDLNQLMDSLWEDEQDEERSADKGKSSSDEENDLLGDDEICDIVLTQRSQSRSAAISEDEERLGQNLPLWSGDESENLDHSETTREKRTALSESEDTGGRSTPLMSGGHRGNGLQREKRTNNWTMSGGGDVSQGRSSPHLAGEESERLEYRETASKYGTLESEAESVDVFDDLPCEGQTRMEVRDRGDITGTSKRTSIIGEVDEKEGGPNIRSDSELSFHDESDEEMSKTILTQRCRRESGSLDSELEEEDQEDWTLVLDDDDDDMMDVDSTPQENRTPDDSSERDIFNGSMEMQDIISGERINDNQNGSSEIAQEVDRESEPAKFEGYLGSPERWRAPSKERNNGLLSMRNSDVSPKLDRKEDKPLQRGISKRFTNHDRLHCSNGGDAQGHHHPTRRKGLSGQKIEPKSGRNSLHNDSAGAGFVKPSSNQAIEENILESTSFKGVNDIQQHSPELVVGMDIDDFENCEVLLLPCDSTESEETSSSAVHARYRRERSERRKSIEANKIEEEIVDLADDEGESESDEMAPGKPGTSRRKKFHWNQGLSHRKAEQKSFHAQEAKGEVSNDSSLANRSASNTRGSLSVGNKHHSLTPVVVLQKLSMDDIGNSQDRHDREPSTHENLEHSLATSRKLLPGESSSADSAEAASEDAPVVSTSFDAMASPRNYTSDDILSPTPPPSPTFDRPSQISRTQGTATEAATQDKSCPSPDSPDTTTLLPGKRKLTLSLRQISMDHQPDPFVLSDSSSSSGEENTKPCSSTSRTRHRSSERRTRHKSSERTRHKSSERTRHKSSERRKSNSFPPCATTTNSQSGITSTGRKSAIAKQPDAEPDKSCTSPHSPTSLVSPVVALVTNAGSPMSPNHNSSHHLLDGGGDFQEERFAFDMEEGCGYDDFHFGMDDFDDDINVHNVEEADKPDEEVDRSTDKGDGVEVEHHKTAEDEYSSSRGADGSRHGNGCSVSDGENEMPTLKPMVRNVDDEIDLTQESSEGSEAGDVDAREEESWHQTLMGLMIFWRKTFRFQFLRFPR